MTFGSKVKYHISLFIKTAVSFLIYKIYIWPLQGENDLKFIRGQVVKTLKGSKFIEGETTVTADGLKFVAG